MELVAELFESTILHEIVHYGDNARTKPMFDPAKVEIGKEFEKEAYGKDVSAKDFPTNLKKQIVSDQEKRKKENQKESDEN